MVINAIGSNLDGFLKFVGSTDADNIGTSQSGTASTALTLNGASVTATDPDGLVDNETLAVQVILHLMVHKQLQQVLDQLRI